MIAAAEGRLTTTQAELDAIATEVAAIAARDQHHGRERARLGRERAVAGAGAAVGTWRDQLGALGELLLVEDPALPAAEALAADRQAQARKKLEEARATRSHTGSARTTIVRKRKRVVLKSSSRPIQWMK